MLSRYCFIAGLLGVGGRPGAGLSSPTRTADGEIDRRGEEILRPARRALCQAGQALAELPQPPPRGRVVGLGVGARLARAVEVAPGHAVEIGVGGEPRRRVD